MRIYHPLTKVTFLQLKLVVNLQQLPYLQLSHRMLPQLSQLLLELTEIPEQEFEPKEYLVPEYFYWLLWSCLQGAALPRFHTRSFNPETSWFLNHIRRTIDPVFIDPQDFFLSWSHWSILVLHLLLATIKIRFWYRIFCGVQSSS